jgi:hypothetical protein
MITRKAFRGSRLKVQREPGLQPETQIPFLNSRTDSELIPSKEREWDNRNSAQSPSDRQLAGNLQVRLEVEHTAKEKASSLYSLKDEMRKFYD